MNEILHYTLLPKKPLLDKKAVLKTEKTYISSTKLHISGHEVVYDYPAPVVNEDIKK